MFQLMTECVEQLKDYLEKPAKNEEILEMKEIVSRFNTEIIGSCAFGLQFNAIKDESSKFREMGRKLFEPSILAPYKRIVRIIFPIIAKILNIRSLTKEQTDFFIGVVKDTIEYRETNKIIRNDFMQLLIQLKNKGSIQYDGDDESSNDNKNISNHEVINETRNNTEMGNLLLKLY